MRPMMTCVAAVVFLAGWSQKAQAQFRYEWHRDGQPISGSIEVPAGSSFTLQVFLKEQDGGTILQAEKLLSAGVRAQYGSTAGVIQVPNTSAISRNPALTDYILLAVNNPNCAQFSATVRVLEPGLAPDANNRILIGSLTFQVTGSVGSSTLLQAVDILESNDTFTGLVGGQGNQELDALIANAPLTILVAPVPEPATVLLFGAVGMAAAQVARKKWHSRLTRREAVV